MGTSAYGNELDDYIANLQSQIAEQEERLVNIYHIACHLQADLHINASSHRSIHLQEIIDIATTDGYAKVLAGRVTALDKLVQLSQEAGLYDLERKNDD